MRLLWEACQIPDFRKLAEDSHIRLCGRVFGHVVRDGRSADRLAGPARSAPLDRVDGDIDTLMQRLAGVRVWSYIAARADWVPDAPHWQGRAREVEDRLSDVLHERLTTRFVDRRAAHLMRRLEAGERGIAVGGDTARRGGGRGPQCRPCGGFGFVPDPMSEGEARRLVVRAARRALREEMPLRVTRLEAEADAGFAWLADQGAAGQAITWAGAPVARLRPGADALRPLAEVLDSEFLDGPSRERVRVRVQRFVDARVHEALAPLVAAATAADADGALRGPLHRLAEGLGWCRVPPRTISRRRCAGG